VEGLLLQMGARDPDAGAFLIPEKGLGVLDNEIKPPVQQFSPRGEPTPCCDGKASFCTTKSKDSLLGSIVTGVSGLSSSTLLAGIAGVGVVVMLAMHRRPKG